MTTAEASDQRMSALQVANEVRSANKLTKQLVGSLPRKQAFEVVAAIIRDPEGREEAMRIGPLLCAIPKFGEVALGRAVTRFYLRPNVPLRALPPGKREQIAQYLEARAREAVPVVVLTAEEKHAERLSILRVMMGNEGPMLALDVADHLGLNRRSSSQKLLAMKVSGFVTSARDGERLLWDLTPRGRGLVS